MNYLNRKTKTNTHRQAGVGLRVFNFSLAFLLCFLFTAAFPAFAEDVQTAVPTSGKADTVAADDQGKPANYGALEFLAESSYPQHGFAHMTLQNCGLKLFFNGNVTDESVLQNNLKCFTLKNQSDGKTVPVKAVVGDKRNDYILVIAEPNNKTRTLDNKTEYNLVISGKLASTDRGTLGEDVSVDFSTVDTAASTQIYMVIMALMLAGMIGMTVLQNKRKKRLEAEVAAGVKGEKVNPYKYAKEKGITVDEAMAQLEKERHRRAKRLGVTADELDKKIEAAKRKPTRPGAKRVAGPRPISAAGSAYKTGRKAIAEQKKREAAAKRAAGTTRPKNKGGKGKSKR